MELILYPQADITRTKGEAREIILAFEARIRAGELSLGDLAVSESDCSSARKRGDLYGPRCSPTFFTD